MPINIPDSEALPITPRRKNKKRRKVQPATQAERDAHRFDAIKAEFDWSNDEWAATWLPWVRLAAVQLASDDRLLQETMRECVQAGEAPNLLEGWARLKRHLDALSKTADAAMHRTFLVLERLGYSPDNPPPDSKVN